MLNNSSPTFKIPDLVKERFNIVAQLGMGSYGSVFKVSDKKTMEIFAVKLMLEVEEIDGGLSITAIREIANLHHLIHPNIVFLHDVIIQNGIVSLILEYVDMNLREYMSEIPGNSILPLMQVKYLWYQLLQAVCYCHQRNVMHRDLKPTNILINKKGELKIADFGMAGNFAVKIRMCTTTIETLWYRAPELLLGSQQYLLGADMWAVGCIFGEIAINKPLMPGDCEIDQLMKTFSLLSSPTEKTMKGLKKMREWRDDYPVYTESKLRSVLSVGNLDDRGISIIENLLVYEPDNRTSANVLLKDPFFNDLDKKQLPAGDWDGEYHQPGRYTRVNYHL